MVTPSAIMRRVLSPRSMPFSPQRSTKLLLTSSTVMTTGSVSDECLPPSAANATAAPRK